MCHCGLRSRLTEISLRWVCSAQFTCWKLIAYKRFKLRRRLIYTERNKGYFYRILNLALMSEMRYLFNVILGRSSAEELE